MGNTWLGKDVPLYLSLFLDDKYHVGSDPLTDLVPGHVQEPRDGHLLEVMCLDTQDTSNFSFIFILSSIIVSPKIQNGLKKRLYGEN